MADRGRDSEHNEGAIKAAASVFAEYGTFIRGVIRYHVNNGSREQDVYQEFFLRLIARPVPPDVRNVKAYLYRAISNDIFDLTRQQERYQHHLQKYSERSQISVYNALSEDALTITDEVGSVFGYLAKWLRPREVQVVTMRYRDDYTVGEIAARLGIPRRTVSRYLSSGLGKLRKVLAIE